VKDNTHFGEIAVGASVPPPSKVTKDEANAAGKVAETYVIRHPANVDVPREDLRDQLRYLLMALGLKDDPDALVIDIVTRSRSRRG